MTSTHPKTIAKLARCQVPEAAPQPDGPPEVKALTCIGGPFTGQKRADTVEPVRIMQGHIYKKVVQNVGNPTIGWCEFTVWGYFGPEGMEAV